MSVKRYRDIDGMYGDIDGKYVLASDAEQLERRCRELADACRHLANASSSMNMWVKDGIPVEVADYWERSYDKALALLTDAAGELVATEDDRDNLINSAKLVLSTRRKPEYGWELVSFQGCAIRMAEHILKLYQPAPDGGKEVTMTPTEIQAVRQAAERVQNITSMWHHDPAYDKLTHTPKEVLQAWRDDLQCLSRFALAQIGEKGV